MIKPGFMKHHNSRQHPAAY
uniref:Uncharacterized protein n=1 Tax=Anguilla anguilla TaxID=7936 RepID=A0A0E9U5S6_ANGAN